MCLLIAWILSCEMPVWIFCYFFCFGGECLTSMSHWTCNTIIFSHAMIPYDMLWHTMACLLTFDISFHK